MGTKSSKLERTLFSFTRVFAVLGAILGILVLIGVIISFVKSGNSTHVSLSDLQIGAVGSQAKTTGGSLAVQKEVSFPENVKMNFVGDNLRILEGWISSIPKEDKQDFVNNLSSVITEAENQKLDVMEAINQFKTAKLAKIEQASSNKYENLGATIGRYVVLFAVLMFIAIISLVLVLLAIERNTRADTASPHNRIDEPTSVKSVPRFQKSYEESRPVNKMGLSAAQVRAGTETKKIEMEIKS